MPRWWEIARLRLQYGNLDTAGFQDLLENTLRHPDKQEVGALHRFLLDLCFELRPLIAGPNACPPDDMRWKYWVAMAMRYLPALAQNRGALISSTNTLPNVRQWIEHDRDLMQALLFGDREMVNVVLRDGVNSATWRALLPEPSPEQAVILDIIVYHMRSKNISERQVGNWSTELHEKWAGTLQNRLQVGLLVRLTHWSERAATRFAGADTPASPAMFEQYMKRFREAGLDWAYGQALGYHNELKRRYRQASRSASWVINGGICAALSVALMAIVFLLGAHPILRLLTMGITLLCLVVPTIHMVRAMIVLVNAGGIVDAQMQTLSEIEAVYLPDRE